MRLGVIAEDTTDCEALSVLIRRIAAEAQKADPKVKLKSTRGCAQLVRKARPVIREWVRVGISAVVLVHDLDRDKRTGALNDEVALRRKLDAQVANCGVPYVICIPAEEIEAWFWADDAILKELSGLGGRGHHHPHMICSPKELLGRISRDAKKRPLYSTNDNPALAARLDMAICAKRCRAFAQFRSFVESHI